MEEMTDSLAAAWKVAMRGMKSGYKMTKSALRSMQPEKPRRAGGRSGGGAAAVTARRVFQQRYGGDGTSATAGSGAGAAARAASESSETDSLDEGDEDDADAAPLTDAEVRERVEHKFFDKAYDAVRFELRQMEVTYADSEEASRAERAAAEAKLLLLRQQCDVVSTTLKKRVLAHHQAFMSGVEQIRQINDRLLQTSSDAKKARSAVRRSRHEVATQIALLAQHRRRSNVRDTLQLLQAMAALYAKRSRLMALLASGLLLEAGRLLQDEGAIAQEAALRGVRSMRPLVDEWRLFCRDPAKRLQPYIETVLTECLTVKFMPATYRNVFDALPSLGNVQEACSLVTALLWRTAVHILTRSLIEMSYIKSEEAPIADIAEAIQPDHWLLCICQVSARLTDFVFLFLTLVRLHQDEARGSTPVAAAHAQALQYVRDVGCRIGRDLVEKLALTLSHARLGGMDVDRVLHIFVVVSMCVEAIASLGIGPKALGSARTQMKGILQHYMALHFQQPKARAVVQFMQEDPWRVSETAATSVNVLAPLSPEAYRGAIRVVRKYLEVTEADGEEAEDSNSNSCNHNSGEAEGTAVAAEEAATCIGAATAENPFYAPAMLTPPDLSHLVRTRSFAAYWASRPEQQKQQPSGQKPAAVAATTSNGVRADPGTTTGAAAMPVAEAAPTLLTSSGLAVANVLLEYQARIAVRFPPLAADILDWSEELCALFCFTVADSFVSLSRSVALEHQGGFSAPTRRRLAELRVAGLRAMQAGSHTASSPLLASPYETGGLAHAATAGGSTETSFSFRANSTAGSNTTGASPLTATANSGSATTAAAATVGGAEHKFPPRLGAVLRGALTSEAQQYALQERTTASATCVTLAFFYEAAVRALAPLLPRALVDERLDRARRLYAAMLEVLHVSLHRLCQAILPLEPVCSEIARLKPNKDEVRVGPYVHDLVQRMKELNARRAPMPSAALERLFLRRLVFAVQTVLVHEYSKLASKRRLQDMMVMQLQVDAQTFQQQVAAVFGRDSVVLADYVLSFVKTGFYTDSREQLLAWLRQHHRYYAMADLLSWLAAGDRVFKLQLQDTLTNELHHEDTIPVLSFMPVLS